MTILLFWTSTQMQKAIPCVCPKKEVDKIMDLG